jgi:uncharacterized protein
MRHSHHILFYTTVADYVERRKAFREEHLNYAQAAHARGDLILGGALDDPVDEAILIFKTGDPAVVEDFARHDPYVTNGLVTKWRVRPWTVVIGA